MSDFMPKRQKKQAITIRMEVWKVQRITYFAAKFNLSRCAFVNQCIDYALSMMEMGKES